MKKTRLAVNGTLMRGLELNKNLVAVGAKFLVETKTSADYRIWSIDDRHPGMLRAIPPERGRAVTVEVWELDGAQGKREITEFGGWREYTKSKASA